MYIQLPLRFHPHRPAIMAVHQRPQHMEFLASFILPLHFPVRPFWHLLSLLQCHRRLSTFYKNRPLPAMRTSFTAKGRYPLPVCNILRFALWPVVQLLRHALWEKSLRRHIDKSVCHPPYTFPINELFRCQLKTWHLGYPADTGQPPLPSHPHAGIRYYPAHTTVIASAGPAGRADFPHNNKSVRRHTSIRPRQLFFSTLKNPKALLFAAGILPMNTWDNPTNFILVFSAFCLVLLPVTMFWMSFGRAILAGESRQIKADLLYKGSAAMLVLCIVPVVIQFFI